MSAQKRDRIITWVPIFFFVSTLLLANQSDLHRLVVEGDHVLQKGEVAQAEKLFLEVLRDDPNYLPGLRGLGRVKIKQRMFPEAVRLYKKIVSLNRFDLNAQITLADIYSWMGDFDHAITLYKDIVYQEPLNLEALNGLARVLRWAMRFDDAEFYYRKALQIEPKNNDALHGIARVYAMAGNFGKALQMIEKAIQYNPRDPESLRVKGLILAWNNRFDESELNYKRALKLDPKCIDTHEGLGDLYRWQRKYLLAIASYRSVLKLDPRNVRTLLQLARMYKETNMRREAEATVRKAFQIQPDIAEGFEILRELESQQNVDYAMILNNYVEPVILLGSLLIVTIYYRWRLKSFSKRPSHYKVLSYHVLPSVMFVWILIIVLEQFVDFSNFYIFKELIEFATLIILAAAFISLWQVSRVSDKRQKKVVLAIGAHPDDIELGCAGTLAKYKDMGYEVHALVASLGENGNPHAHNNGSRKAEAERAARVLGLDSLQVLNFKDTEFSKQLNAIKSEIEETIKNTNAEIIITQSPHDIHQDHGAVFEATKIAARGARTILCFEDVSTEPDFDANYFVDITDHIGDKIRAVGAHHTQKAKSYMHPEKIRGRAAHRGLQSGVPFAEAFLMYRGLDV